MTTGRPALLSLTCVPPADTADSDAAAAEGMASPREKVATAAAAGEATERMPLQQEGVLPLRKEVATVAAAAAVASLSADGVEDYGPRRCHSTCPPGRYLPIESLAAVVESVLCRVRRNFCWCHYLVGVGGVVDS